MKYSINSKEQKFLIKNFLSIHLDKNVGYRVIKYLIAYIFGKNKDFYPYINCYTINCSLEVLYGHNLRYNNGRSLKRSYGDNGMNHLVAFPWACTH